MRDHDTALQQEIVDPSVMSSSTLEVLQRAEIDVQINTAKRFPRSLADFQRRATGMATLDPDTAASCIYRRPVGDGKIAEGMSIRMAEIVAASYGNIRSASRIIEQTERFVKCQGVCHDLETNNSSSSECVEPTVKRDGKPYSEAQRAVVAKACLAKAHRDAIFKVIPRALARPIELAAKKVIAGDTKGVNERRAMAEKWVDSLGIDKSRVFAVLNVQGWADVTAEHLVELTGLRTAIKDGDTTADEAFPPLSGDEPAALRPGKSTFGTKKSATSGASAPPGATSPVTQNAPALAQPKDRGQRAVTPAEAPVQEQDGDEQQPENDGGDQDGSTAPLTDALDADVAVARILELWVSKREGKVTPEQARAGLALMVKVSLQKTPDTLTADEAGELLAAFESGAKDGMLRTFDKVK